MYIVGSMYGKTGKLFLINIESEEIIGVTKKT